MPGSDVLTNEGEVVSKRSFAFLVALILSVAIAGPIFATGISVTVGSDPQTATTTNFEYGTVLDPEGSGISSWFALDPDGNPIIQGVASYAGTNFTLINAYGLLKEDPYVTSVVGLINPTNATQTYTITVSLPIAPPFPYNATVASSVGVSVTDSIGGSVTAASVAPDGIYTGTVNGAPVLTLMANPTSVSCASAGCSNTLADNGGVPLLPAGPGVATSIGIILKFTLTAFDQVAITSRFEIVPEPSTVLLLGVGLVALGIVRRRAA